MPENHEKSRFERRFGRNGLHWIGKKDGVHQWRGSWNNLPLWFCRMFLGLTSVMGLVAGGTGLALLLGAKVPLGVPLTFGLTTALYAGITTWMYRWRQRVLSLSSPAEVAQRLGLSEAATLRVAQEHGIKPVYNINGQDMYDLTAFGDAGSLLRAASAPEHSETLLRAATPTDPHTPAEQLLRPTAQVQETTNYTNYHGSKAEENPQRIQMS